MALQSAEFVGVALPAVSLGFSALALRRLWQAARRAHVRNRLDATVPSAHGVGIGTTSRLGVASSAAAVRRRFGTLLSTRHRAERATVVFAEGIARSVRSGAPLRVAIAQAASAAGPPLAADSDRFLRRLDAGETFEDALRWWADRSRRTSLRMVFVTCGMGYVSGGPLAESFDSIAEALRARLDSAAEARALSSQARASAVLLVLLPIVVAVLSVSADARTRYILLMTPLGWACLVGAVVLDVAGWVWMGRLVRAAR